MLRFTLLIIALLIAAPASAYIGPGAGISVLGSLLGIIVTIIVAIGAIIMWPLRKVLKKRRQNASNPEEEAGAPESAARDGEQGEGQHD